MPGCHDLPHFSGESLLYLYYIYYLYLVTALLLAELWLSLRLA